MGHQYQVNHSQPCAELRLQFLHSNFQENTSSSCRFVRHLEVEGRADDRAIRNGQAHVRDRRRADGVTGVQAGRDVGAAWIVAAGETEASQVVTDNVDVLVDEVSISDAVQHAEESGFDVLPANSDLTAAEVELLDAGHKERRLKSALDEVKGLYDYILIDCPPSLNMLTLNGLVAADGVVIAMQCEYFALEGLSALIGTIEKVVETVNSTLKVEGILRTMYDPRMSLTNEVSAQLESHFGDSLYRTVIPRNVRLAEAPSYGLPAMYYDRKSRGAKAYLALAGEIVRREEQPTEEPGQAATADKLDGEKIWP